MRRALCFFAAVAQVAADDYAAYAGEAATGGAPKGNHPFLTTATAFQFVKDSVLLSFDVSMFVVKRTQNRILSLLPEEARTPITNVMGTTYETWQKTREQHDETAQKITALFTQYTAMFVGVVTDVNQKFEAVAAPLQDRLNVIFGDFAAQYPDAPLIPEGLVDRLFMIFFLLFVISYAYCFAKKIICLPCIICKCCCKRKNKGAGGRPAGRYSNKKKN